MNSQSRTSRHRTWVAIRRCALLVPTWALLCACEDPLVEPQDIVGPRIIAAQVASAARPEVAQPAPGEEARLRWWLVSDTATQARGQSWICLAHDTTLGLSSCSEAPFASSELVIESAAPAELSFSLPQDTPLDQPWVAWLVACAQAELVPAIDDPQAAWRHPERAYRCSDGSRPLLAAYRSRVVVPPNQNPKLEDIELTIDGQPWSSLSAPVPGAACSDTDVRVAAGSPLRIESALPPALQERYAEPTKLDRGREGLFLTHLSTSIGLSRAYTYVAADSEGAALSLELSVPVSAAPEQPVQEAFYLIARDERGGVDVLVRSLCIEPITPSNTPPVEEPQ